MRAVPPTPITFNQPLRGGRHRAISGRLLGETQFDGVLHHYRVVDGDGVLFLVPPHWVEVDAPVATRTLEPATGEARA